MLIGFTIFDTTTYNANNSNSTTGDRLIFHSECLQYVDHFRYHENFIHNHTQLPVCNDLNTIQKYIMWVKCCIYWPLLLTKFIHNKMIDKNYSDKIEIYFDDSPNESYNSWIFMACWTWKSISFELYSSVGGSSPWLACSLENTLSACA